MSKEKALTQGSFSFDGRPEPGPPSPSKGKGIKIDCDKILGELEDLVGPIVKVELNELQKAACHILETDVGKFHFIVIIKYTKFSEVFQFFADLDIQIDVTRD